MVKNFNTTLIKNFLTYSCGAVILRGITWATTLVTVTILTTSEFGLLSLINNFCALFPLFLNLGLRQVFGLEYFHHDSSGRKQVFHKVIQTYLVIAIPIFILLLISQHWLNHLMFLGLASKSIMILAMFYCFIQFFSELYLQVLRYQSNARKLTIIQLTAALVSITSTAILVFYYNFRILGVIMSNFLGISTICAIAFFYYKKQIGFQTKKYIQLPPLKDAKNLLWLGLPFIPNILFNWILSFGDRLVLADLTNMHNVGIYAFADQSTMMFQMTVLLPLSGSYVPYMLKQYAEKKESLKTIENRNLKTMWFAMAFMGVSVTLASLFALKVGPWFLPAKYHQSLQYVLPMLLGNVLFMGTYFSSCYLVFKKKTWSILVTNIAAASTNIGLNLLLIPRFNIYGCVIATLFSNALFFVLTYGILIHQQNHLSQVLIKRIRHGWLSTIPNLFYHVQKLFSTKKYALQHNHHFTVLITSYNNSQYYVKNLQSVLEQKYSNFNVIYVDDQSPDNTGQLVQEYLEQYDNKHLVTLICNSQRNKKLSNLYSAIHSCPDNSIIVELDGDDYLIDPHVLSRLNKEYQHGSWAVYGNYINNPPELAKKLNMQNWCKQTPLWVVKNKAFRERVWHYSGLRTYYAWLFKRIKKEDLMIDQNFIPVFHDAATFYPILEMAETNISYISQPLLMRNIDSPLNDFKNIDKTVEAKVHNKVLTTPHYQTAEKL